LHYPASSLDYTSSSLLVDSATSIHDSRSSLNTLPGVCHALALQNACLGNAPAELYELGCLPPGDLQGCFLAALAFPCHLEPVVVYILSAFAVGWVDLDAYYPILIGHDTGVIRYALYMLDLKFVARWYDNSTLGDKLERRLSDNISHRFLHSRLHCGLNLSLRLGLRLSLRIGFK